MVEGDLMDLTLPTLLQAVCRERSTAVLRLQRGVDHAALYFHEGVLVHAQSGETEGDEAALALLGWPDGRFRLARDPQPQPRTVSERMARLVTTTDAGPRASANNGSTASALTTDEQLLHDLLTHLTRLEQD